METDATSLSEETKVSVGQKNLKVEEAILIVNHGEGRKI